MPERNYNSITMVLQRYYNGITFLLVLFGRKAEGGGVEFWGNFSDASVGGEFGGRVELVHSLSNDRQGEISREIVRLFERRCKGTLMKRGFANLFWEKCKKSAFLSIFRQKIVNFSNEAFFSPLRYGFNMCATICCACWNG